jgi:Bacterial Ig domain
MYLFKNKTSRLVPGLAAAILLLGASAVSAQSVNLTVDATRTLLPDGQSVPMWSYHCSDAGSANASCAAANPAAQKSGSGWSPVVISVPYTGAGTTLTINLVNNLVFAGGKIPTSLVIVGQVGGGLGGGGTTTPSPVHSGQGVTWPTADPTNTSTPPAQLPRVQSFGTEVAAGNTTPTALVWNNLRPGTYLLESGTHPSIQVPMGLYGILVVTTPATGSAPAQAYPADATSPGTAATRSASVYDTDVTLALGEIDPVQNVAVDAAVRTAGFSETAVWSALPGGCAANAATATCYPPAVNYSPRYYLVNGVSFDRTNLSASTAQLLVPPAVGVSVKANTGNVLVRLVNAGSRMHVPAIVNMPMSLLAEDGNPLPGLPRIQNETFLAAGKTNDVIVKPLQANSAYTAATYALFDRQLSLSTNNQRDGGMQSYIAIAGGAISGVGSAAGSGTVLTGAVAKSYYCVTGQTLSVADPTLGLLGGSSGANGVAVTSTTLPGVLTVQSNGTFTYAAPASGACGGSFAYTINGTKALTGTITECDATTQGSGCALGLAPVLANDSFTSSNAQVLAINPPGVLLNDSDPSGLTLKVDATTVPNAASVGLTSLVVNADGSFSAVAPAAGTYSFTYNVKNSQQTAASTPATVTLNFPKGSGLVVNLQDKNVPTRKINDYRWIIEEDRTFWIDPKCQVNTGGGARPNDSYGRPCPPIPVEALGYNFHSAGMPVVATGCVGTMSCESGQTLLGSPAICDVGDGICRTTDAGGAPLTTANAYRTPLDPSQVALDPDKHYFISVMPGDGINPTLQGVGGPVTDPKTGKTRQFDPAIDCPNDADFAPGSGSCGHNMGGAQIGPQFDAQHSSITPAVTISLAQTPLPTAKIAVLVYQDDYPLNGENDAGGGVDILAPNEAGLGGFQIELLDQAGGLGDSTGQITYDMFNMPVSNSLAGTIDPMTKLDACPLTSNPDGLIGMVITCPTYESDGKTMSPLAGQAVISNLYPGIYEVQAFPAADRVGRGEEWLQTNTLDGGKPHEAFVRPGEPAYFQEFGPGGFHVQIGFANPKIINDRRSNAAGTGLCDPTTSGGGGLTCNSTITGHVHGNHMSRTPDERTYDTGSYAPFQFSNCYVSLGIPDEQDFAFVKCDADGNFTMTGLPPGTYKIAVFDQWNDIMLDGLISAVTLAGGTQDVTLTATQWRTNLYTRTYLDTNNNGIPDRDADGNDLEAGLALVPINIRYRDGSKGFANSTDLNGYATYNEVFPFMNWLVVEPDQTRFKPTGQHVVYDSGGPDDCSPDAQKAYGADGHCTGSNTSAFLAGTVESNSLPVALRVPGAVYCVDADCTASGESILNGAYWKGSDTSPTAAKTTGLSSGRIDPPWKTEAWQGLLGQHSFIDFGMKPFAAHENGGIQGMVVYASTRPFDDPTLDVQLTWEPMVPNVKINLYKESTSADGSTTTLVLVDSTYTSSWDAWAQGFRTASDGKSLLQVSGVNADGSAFQNAYVPNMNCPGQDPTSGFFATLQGSKMWLDTADSTGNKKPLAYNSQFKCFDGWSMLNQIQPGPYDGKYQFPSIVALDPVTGKPAGSGALNGLATTQLKGTNCNVCLVNPDDGTPMLPAGKYVVEVVPPTGYEIVKEEDKNILMGDIYIAPVTQQFAGLGNVYILPDQAAINAYYNANNPLNSTTNLGVVNPREDFATNDQMWPCAGQVRIVPDTMSLFPQVGQTAPFAGASRPLCDRKEVTLSDQMTVSARFYVFTKNHIAGHFVGGMTNDMASEFDPFSPQFGEKFGVPNLPIRMRDFVGDEVTRVYGDQWGAYNGLYFSSWEVNPPNPTGYAPQMSVACMNDPGPIADPSGAKNSDGTPVMITDPAYNPAYSNFCYETPFMPGFTAYMDTPVVPVQAFADHYNLPDAEYPDGTPVIKRADFQAAKFGPWSAGSAGVGTITVNNAGSKYTSVPTVNISGGGGTGAVAAAKMSVSSIVLGTVSSTYTSAPAVTLTGGNGSGAQATACIGVSSVAIGNGGSGYRFAPIVIFTGGGVNGFGNVARANATVVGGKVTAINVTSPGCGYTSAPNVAIVGLGGTGAAATASINLAAVNVTNGGSGYTSAPAVNFSAGSATATALLDVNAVTVSVPGMNFTSAPTVAFSGGGGSGASATASLGAVSATSPLILTAYGDRAVQNPQFAGPSATSAPFNAKTVLRHYGFGTQCTALGGSCAAISSVSVGGLPAAINSWSDTAVSVTMPGGLAPCPVQQRGASKQVCGEVVVTAGNGKLSIDGVTVTIGGNTPTYVDASSPSSNKWGEFYPNPLQTAIDNAKPGDLIMVNQGSYRENLIMWKPVRLQGVGNGVVTINADAQPAGKMDAWRRRVSCLFGLNIQGTPNPGNSSYDPSGQYSCPADQYFRADRIPFEGFVGWDASSNGNLAQVLQEPSLMGAYEGAGITVVGRGVNQSGSNNSDLWGQVGGAGTFADGSVYTSVQDCTPRRAPANNVNDYATSNFLCNPSGIDGFSIINSSQGGGGIYMHGWSHNMQIANNRISANAGTLSGGINLGSGETPPAYVVDNTICGNTGVNPAPLCPPIPAGTALNAQIPFQFNSNVHIHHNQILDNASIGDALFSGSPAGAGGVTISAGSDAYELDHNWIAANLTSSDGGGVAHMGVSFNGKIHNNFVLFNQANNPTLPVDGGGIVIMGAQEDRTLPNGQECGGTTDLDCPPGIGDGTGPGLVIDSNLLLGNSAEDGSGGGLRLRQTNGSEVAAFLQNPERWYGITVTNNIIANNVAGWDGAGVSLQDSFKTLFVNNTVASNDTTASAGVLFKTLGAIDAASPPPGCLPTPDPTQPQNPNCLLSNGPHIPQPAGLVTMQNTPNMMSQLPNGVVCPAGFGYGDAADSRASRTNGRCVLVSLPQISNDLFWQNRAFHVEIVDQNGNPISGSPTNPNGTGLFSHQNIVALLPLFKQSYTGQCVAPPANQELYWDVGVRMDLLPDQNGHALVFDATTVGAGSYPTGTGGGSGVTANLNDQGPIGLVASNSIFSDNVNLKNITGPQNVAPSATPVQGQYCNGARIPPEQCGTNQGANNPAMCKGYFTPAGQSETVGVAPVFTFNGISATATVDEGNNWINMTYGPLTLSRPPAVGGVSTPSAEPTVASAAVGIAQGAYSIGSNSDAVGGGNAQANGVPGNDFYGQKRPKNSVSIGAVELIPGAPTLTAIAPASGAASTVIPVSLTGTNFTTGSSVAISGTGVTASNVTRVSATQLTASFAITNSATLGARTVTVTSAGGTSGSVTFTVTAAPPPPLLSSITPANGGRGLSVSVTLAGANLTGATAVNVARAGGGGGGGGGGFNNGVTVSNIVVDSSGTHLTATFTIDAGATIAARNVSVTTGVGTSGNLTFNVTAPPAPTLASISPASGAHNTAVTVTFTGTNLSGGSVNVVRAGGGGGGFRNGVNVSNTSVNAAGTVLTATFNIANNATLAPRNVSVTTGGGTTANRTFTVN